MALLFMEGFEVDGADATALGRKWAQATSPGSAQTGRLHGTALGAQGATRLRTPVLTAATGTVVLGFGYKDRTSGSAANGFEIRVLSGATEQLTLRFVQVTSSTFRIDLYRGATLLDSSAAYATGSWHYFEFKAVIATGTGGSYSLRRNTVEAFSDTGVNTANSGAANWNVVYFHGNSATGAPTFDDIYILDGTGSALNDFLGDSTIEGRLPSGDGTTTDWTPSSGSDHYTLLADSTDATRVTSTTAGHVDLLTFDPLSFITGDIHCVMAFATAQLDSLGTRELRLKALSGATTDDGAVQVVGSTSYATFLEIFDVDPDTTTAWTVAGVNAAEFGFELES